MPIYCLLVIPHRNKIEMIEFAEMLLYHMEGEGF